MDAETSRVLKQRLQRRQPKIRCNDPKSETKTQPDDVSLDTSMQTDTDSDVDFKPTPSTSTAEIKIALPSLAEAIDRVGLSSRKVQ